jgi:hypothetical protein
MKTHVDTFTNSTPGIADEMLAEDDWEWEE